MLNIRVETVIHQLVRQELQGGKGREKEAIYFHLDCRMSHHLDNQTYDESRGLHLLYHANPASTYINVFGAITDSPFDGIDKVTQWEHLASHDSCWRDVPIFSQIYFGMANEINAKLKGKGKSEIAPKDMHEWHGFGLTDALFSWVPVLVTKDPECKQSYRKLVKVKL